MFPARLLAVAVLACAGCGLRSAPPPDGGGGGPPDAGCEQASDCTAPPNGTAACADGKCTFACAPPLLRCATSCCGAIAVTAGSKHTCVSTDAGSVLCWGAMFTAGDGTYELRRTPVSVVGLGAPATALSAGNLNTCALLVGGAVKCWGAGMLGNGVNAPSPMAEQVTGLTSPVSQLASGGSHACVVVNGGVKCWGEDAQGQQGCNDCGTRLAPGDVTGLAYDVKQVTAGTSHACAVLTDGGVKCWGFNVAGECGDGVTVRRYAPVRATSLDAGVDEVHGGWGYTCSRTASQVRCFGANLYGECGAEMIGDSFYDARPLALPASGLAQLALAPTSHHVCALVSGEVYCWGQNDRGQLGDGNMTPRGTPERALGITEPIVSLAVGGKHTCAVTAAGGVLCWGSNSDGQLGHGSMELLSLTPVQVR